MNLGQRAALWDDVELGDVVTLHRGYDLPSSQRREGSVPVVSSSGITGYHDEASVAPPGVVTGRYGTLGEVFFINEPFWPLNTTLYVSDFHGNDPRFVSYLLQCQGLGTQTNAAAVPGVNRNVLHRLSVRRPPVSTQRKIAAVLSAYDELIENNNGRIKALEEMAQRIYNEWFVEFRYPGHEGVTMVRSELGPVPHGWHVVPFTDFADVLSGGTPRTNDPQNWDGSIPFFTPRDASDTLLVATTEKHISEVGLARCNSRLYPPLTIFITARGTVGKVVVTAVPMAMNQSCYAIRGKGLRQEFVLFTLRSQVDYLRANTSGATFDTIIVDTFRRMHCILPSLGIAEAFADTVAPMILAMAVYQAESAAARAARDLLLPRLISGEVDVSLLGIAMPPTAA